MNNKTIVMLLLFSTIIPIAHATNNAAAPDGYYRQLEKFFIKPEAPKRHVTVTIPGQDTASVKKEADLVVHELDRNRTTQLTLELLNLYGKPLANQEASAICVLERFKLVSPDLCDVRSKMFPNSSLWCAIAFAEKCTHSADLVELKKRQAVVKFFVREPALAKKALRAFKNIMDGHRMLLSYFEPSDEATQKVINDVYFGNSWLGSRLNKSCLALGARDVLRFGQSLLWPATLAGITPLLLVNIVKATTTTTLTALDEKKTAWDAVKTGIQEFAPIPDDTLKGAIKKFCLGHYPAAYGLPKDFSKRFDQELARLTESDMYRLAPDELKAQLRGQCIGSYFEKQGLRFGDDQSIHDGYLSSKVGWHGWFPNFKHPGMLAFITSYGIAALWDTLLFFALKKFTADVGLVTNILHNFQTRLIGIAKITKGMRLLAEIADEAQLSELDAMVAELTQFLGAEGSSDLKSLLAALEATTFKDHASVFSNRPLIFAAQKLMESCKALFIRPLAEIGHVETLVRSALFYAEHKENNNPVCFVEFVDEQQPVLHLKGAWNLLFDKQKVVKLDAIKLGKGGAQCIVISGSNGTGKSGSLNTIGYCFFLGKVGGISPAESVAMTSFDKGKVHRNIQENIAMGDSSFMAQQADFVRSCNEVKDLRNNERALIFFDEPLNGTVEETAGRIIYENGKNFLAQQRQAICFIATHAELPTHLEADTRGIFVNYQVEVLEPRLGEFKRTFKLLPGIPEWWFNDAEKRFRFVTWLAEERNRLHSGAQAVCSEDVDIQ